MDTLYTIGIFVALILAFGLPYWIKAVKHRKESEHSRAKNEKAGLHEPVTLHPHIDLLTCIGCASCVQICPEDVLGIVDGRASVVHGMRCVGHALCAEVCPVGAITMGFGKPKQGMEIPYYDEHFMTNIEGLYIVGELGGVGLIKNALEHSKMAVEHISTQIPTSAHDAPIDADANNRAPRALIDILIIGAGPAGIGAALAAQGKGLTHIVLEQDELGGSILHYPRQKLVLTSPVELPLYGKFKLSEISKEELLSLFNDVINRFKLNIHVKNKVETITKVGNVFSVSTPDSSFTAKNVILALGRRGSPRKLGVPGEELPKVYYRLMEAEKYSKKSILIVGGGDSAVEAALALARQQGNIVTLSYRRDSFVRLKEKNEKKINEEIKSGRVKTIFNSEVTEIKPDGVTIKEANGSLHTIPNDFVFIFAGGELPAEFLKKIGVKLRTEEVA